MLLAMLVLGSLAVLGTLTAMSVQGSTASASTHRFHGIAVYAAESGGAAAMAYLRGQVHPTLGFSAFVSPSNATPISPAGISGNNVAPGAMGNPFSSDMQAWYSVVVLNNRSDSGFTIGKDADTTIRIHVTGYGPEGAVASVEWEVKADPSGVPKPFTLLGWRQHL